MKKMIPVYDQENLSIMQVIGNLLTLKSQLDGEAFDSTILLATRLLGRCWACKGTGEEIQYVKPNSNYKVKTSPRGETYYGTQCYACRGSGKQLDVSCLSCGKSAAIMPDQQHGHSYCQKCETRLRAEGILLV